MQHTVHASYPNGRNPGAPNQCVSGTVVAVPMPTPFPLPSSCTTHTAQPSLPPAMPASAAKAKARARLWRALLRLAASYGLDWLVAIALFAVAYTVPLEAVPPVSRFALPGDPALSYPFRHDTIPLSALLLLSVLAPVVVFCAAAVLAPHRCPAAGV